MLLFSPPVMSAKITLQEIFCPYGLQFLENLSILKNLFNTTDLLPMMYK